MKRFISLFLCVVLICTAFASCKGKKNNSLGLEYTYDSYFSDSDEAVIEDYEKLCDAIVNGYDSVSLDMNYIDSINKIYYKSFPLSILVSKLSLNEAKNGVKIEYTNDKETHKKLVDDFVSKVKAVMAECGYGTVSDAEYTLNLYSYIASNIVHDINYTSTYDAIVNNLGSSSSYSSAFEYLLLQAGIPASHIYGLSSKNVSFMTMAEINGENLLFAPFSEYKANKGYGLSYFALSYSDVLELGFRDGFKYTDEEAVVFDEATEKFNALRDTVSYEYADFVITAIKSSGETVTVSIK